MRGMCRALIRSGAGWGGGVSPSGWSSDHSQDLSPPRSPEPSKTSVPGGGEDGIEPVSPPEGMAEPGHPRSAMYPLLYRDGEQAEPRYPLGTGLQGTGPQPRERAG